MIARLRAAALKELGQKVGEILLKRKKYVHQIVSVHQKALCLHCMYSRLAAMQHNGGLIPGLRALPGNWKLLLGEKKGVLMGVCVCV